MKVIVAGAGRLGAQVAQVLAAARYEVTVIEQDEARAAELDQRLAVRLVVGDACDPDLLEYAGVLNTDLLVATTGQDEDNLVVSLLAKGHFGVPRVVARVNDEDNTWLFGSGWGVDTAVPAATPLISLIEEATGAADTVALLRLSKAGVNVIETAISAASRAAGRPLGEVPMPEGTVIATVVRDGRPTVPAADMVLQPGDELLVVSHAATEREVREAVQ
ncbi:MULTISPECIES: potassium channel family protein [unclassified Streptomyces]|uniref:potassium channel family protein n=1 Tax=unclassified Streptomyces TaxID=2593676 RepID=UPI003806CB34